MSCSTIGCKWSPSVGERVRAFIPVGEDRPLLGRVEREEGRLFHIEWDDGVHSAEPTYGGTGRLKFGFGPACERCGGPVRVRWVHHAGHGWFNVLPLEDLTEDERKPITGPYPIWWCEKCSPKKVRRDPAAGQVWQWSDAYGPLVLIRPTTDHTGEGAWTAYSLVKKERECLWIYDAMNPCWYVRKATDAEFIEALASPHKETA